MKGAQAALLYGDDTKKQEEILAGILSRFPRAFVHRFGDDKPAGIGDIHEIQRRAALSPGGEAVHIFIVARASEMTPEASQACLKILEESPPAAYFVFKAENSTLPETLLSRMVHYPCFSRGAEGEPAADQEILRDLSVTKSALEETITAQKPVSNILFKRLRHGISFLAYAKNPRFSGRVLSDIYHLTKPQ